MTITANNICLSIHNKVILNDISISVKQGQHLLIHGDSGSGKTTLLSILTGLQRPDSGEIAYDGQPISQLPAGDMDRFRGKNFGIIFQNFHLLKPLNVQQNIMLANSFNDISVQDTSLMELLQRLNIADKITQSVVKLSAGEAQRVAIARALVHRPKWIFCDEPTSALDDRNTQATLELLMHEAALYGASIIMVTHDARVKNIFASHHQLVLGKSA